MPKFEYFAKDKEGNPVKGVIEAKERNIASGEIFSEEGGGFIILSSVFSSVSESDDEDEEEREEKCFSEVVAKEDDSGISNSS